jgi:hypothetical protein
VTHTRSRDARCGVEPELVDESRTTWCSGSDTNVFRLFWFRIFETGRTVRGLGSTKEGQKLHTGKYNAR